MQHLVKLLQKENIGALLVGDMDSCAKDRFGNTMNHPTNYFLQVREDEAQESLQIIEEEHKKATGLHHHLNANDGAIFNPAAEKANCPACGHSFPTTETTCPDCGLSFG
jgi:rubrerythrin